MMQVHESKTHRVGIDRLETLKSPQTQESIGRLWRVTLKQDVNGLGSGFNTLYFWYLLSGVDLMDWQYMTWRVLGHFFGFGLFLFLLWGVNLMDWKYSARSLVWRLFGSVVLSFESGCFNRWLTNLSFSSSCFSFRTGNSGWICWWNLSSD
jgi:hypothetical protein